MALIECKNVSLAYDGRTVVSDLSFKFNEGDYLCVVGENGSGKSTLIKGILGLVKCSHGTIELGEGLLQNEFGYLPQQTVVQRDFPASVFEVVLSGCLNRHGFFVPMYSKSDKKLAMENMEKLGISNLKSTCYHELSGGQQQRVLLARALCATKKVLLLDEPITGLDPIATAELYSMISKINKEHGISVIMVSHDIRNALDYASHILHIYADGFFYGTKEEYTHSKFASAMLGGNNDV
ncbi:MAG: metal ABC transporter ATP-binding protein [Acutalibacteraceae bacterium]